MIKLKDRIQYQKTVSSDDLIKSVVILMQEGIGDTMRLYSILLSLRKEEPLSLSDKDYLQELIEKNR